MARSNVSGTPNVKYITKKRLGNLPYQVKTDTVLIWKCYFNYFKTKELL